LLGVTGALFVLAYPFAIHQGLSHHGPRHVALLVLALVAALAAWKIRGRWAQTEDLWPVLRVPLSLGLLLGLGAALDHPAFVLALPVVTNAAFLAQFAGSLSGPVPLVERFARLQHQDLTGEERRYCRTVTLVWSVYFAVNAGVTILLTVWAPLSWWTLYTGVLAYVAMGTLFTIEYLVRKYRFRRFGPHLHDRLLLRLLPRPAAAPSAGAP